MVNLAYQSKLNYSQVAHNNQYTGKLTKLDLMNVRMEILKRNVTPFESSVTWVG